MANKDCLFCQMIKGQIPCYKVYEDDHTFAFLDIYPVNKGHTLIVPKTHQRDIRDAEPESLQHLMRTAQKLAREYKQSLGAVGYNLKINNGKQAHQEVMHLHLHLIPRYKNDGLKLIHDRKETEEEKLEQIQKNISSHLA